MNFTDIKTFTYYDKTVIIDGVSKEIDKKLENEITAVQFHKGNDYCIEEPLMVKTDLAKYASILDKYNAVLEVEAENQTTEVDTIYIYKSYYQEVLNKKFKELDYDGIATVTFWASKSGSKYNIEANSLADWYEAIILKNYEILNAVKAGTRTQPTKEEYLAELPQYATYEI